MDALAREMDFTEPRTKPGLLHRLLHALITIISSPKGDQGGWEGGARGM